MTNQQAIDAGLAPVPGAYRVSDYQVESVGSMKGGKVTLQRAGILGGAEEELAYTRMMLLALVKVVEAEGCATRLPVGAQVNAARVLLGLSPRWQAPI